MVGTRSDTPSPNVHTTPKGGRLSFNRFNVHHPSARWVGLQRYLSRTHDTPATSPLPGSLGYHDYTSYLGISW
ncbi:hypothetical protein TNCV_4443431 [Trichonephila clavipes]|nr:hypothetical protein TNCV_4443431 [Trichonephila clavipes]